MLDGGPGIGEQDDDMLKRILSQAWAQEIVAALAAAYMALAKRTIRWEVRNADPVEPLYAGDKGIIGVVWHGRVLMTIAGWDLTRKKATVLASKSREGQIGQRVARWFKVGVVQGSSHNPLKPEKNKGGRQAYREMIRRISEGGCAAVTPDGPRGPRMRCSSGAIRLARDTGAPLVPYTYSCVGKTILRKAWDNHVLPHFFTRGVIIWGDPVYVPADADDAEIERIRLQIETALNDITRQADEACGGEIIEPAAAKRERAAESAA